MAVVTAAVVSTAAIATTTTMSFVNANKQKKLQRQAERDAQEAMDEARKRLEVNYYDQLAVQKEPYELEREALLSAGAQAIQAGVEGQSRGVAPTAGRVVMAQNEAQAGQRTAMGKELTDLAKLSATEESRLRDINVQLDLEEVAGAQMAARDAQEARAAAIAQGMQGVQDMGQMAMQMAPLFPQNIGAQKGALSKMGFTTNEFTKFEALGGKTLGKDEFSSLDFEKIGGMNNAEYRKYIKSLTPKQRQMLFQNEQYSQNYNPFNPF
jgi:hypothetical protein